MANHKSSIKRIRQTRTATLRNRYYGKTTRNAVRKLRALTSKEEAVVLYKKVSGMLDKLAKKKRHPQKQSQQPEIKIGFAYQQIIIERL